MQETNDFWDVHLLAGPAVLIRTCMCFFHKQMCGPKQVAVSRSKTAGLNKYSKACYGYVGYVLCIHLQMHVNKHVNTDVSTCLNVYTCV